MKNQEGFLWLAYRDETDGSAIATCPGLALYVKCSTGMVTSRDQDYAAKALEEAVGGLKKLADDYLEGAARESPTEDPARPVAQEVALHHLDAFVWFLAQSPNGRFWDCGVFEPRKPA